MTTASKIRYLIWRALPTDLFVAVRLRSGERLVLRGDPNVDLGVAYEVFVTKPYHSPRPLDSASVRRIIDVGANVGYTLAFWLCRYPLARIEAFEPHPDFVRHLWKNVAANRGMERVTVHAVAVGVRPGEAYLEDVGTMSHLVEGGAPSAIKVPVVDFFERIGTDHIDILKLDCEGAEHPIVMDPRFATLQIGALAVEWHATLARPDAEREICDRLVQLGWELVPAGDRVELPGLKAGLVWGYRRA
jgi:FkbM family methyltransferase